MKKIILACLLLLLFIFPQKVSAQSQKNEFERGRVEKVLEEGSKKVLDTNQPYQIVEVKITSGQDLGKVYKIEHGTNFTLREYDLVHKGDEVVLSKLGSSANKEYFITDKFRLTNIIILLLGFFALVVAFTRIRGVMAILAMILSIFILIKFIVPSIAIGRDPVIVTLLGASVIVFFSIFLAHGFNKRTAIAVFSTFITLVIALSLSYFFVYFTKLSGVGNEDAYTLQFGQFSFINLRGLLLAGIIIGTLGVLDDITTSLAAAVDELKKANPTLHTKELYARGISIGREHISSLVNTLILAYAGTSLPIFLYISASAGHAPLWYILNTEIIIEETVRALVGSVALVSAVPITTFLAAFYFGNKRK